MVPRLLIGKINRPSQLAQGWTCHQAGFPHSDLGGSTDGEHSLLLFTPTDVLICPCPYAEIPMQPWNPMLYSMNPVTSEVTKIQPSQPDKPKSRVYGFKSGVWTYFLLPTLNMVKKLRVPCVYNSPPWVIQQLTINELATLWYVPLFLQENLE